MNLETVNASQIKAFRDTSGCQRKWAFGYRSGLPRVSTPSQQLGTDVHKQLELYFRDGKPLDLSTIAGEVALAGLHHLPPRHEIAGIELYVSWPTEGWHGTIDLLTPGRVWDHKTTKDFGYALTRDELARDPQALLYAYLSGYRPTVDLRWIYYRTTKPYRSYVVDSQIDFRDPEVQAQIVGLRRTADEIRAIPKDVNPLSLPPNASQCDAYGGCAYRSICNLSAGERLISIMSQAQAAEDAAAKHIEIVRQLRAAAQNEVPSDMSNTAPQLPPPQPGYQWAVVNNAYQQVPIPPAQPGPPAGFPPPPPPGAAGPPPGAVNPPPPGPSFGLPPPGGAPQPPGPPMVPAPPTPPTPPTEGQTRRRRKAASTSADPIRANLVTTAGAFAGALYDAAMNVFADAEGGE